MADDKPDMTHQVRFSLDPISDLETLGRLWRDLEGRSDHSFFVSWGWIGTWLATLPAHDRPSILVGRSDDRVVALAVLGRHTRRRLGCLVARGLFLNETGDPRYDTLTVEYNGILAERGLGPMVTIQALRYLQDQVGGWDELCLGGVAQAGLDLAASVGLRPHIFALQPCDYVDLAAVRVAGGDYLARLSRNSRYQIRRALRLYEARGPLNAIAARSVEEALRFLAELKALHQANWIGRGNPGAFANPYFETFHQALVRDRFPHGEIELLRIEVAGQAVGYLYNFVHAAHVYSYQSGFRYEDDPAVKPGLVSHYLAIERHLTAGAAIYDFMAGATRHKQSLGTDRTMMLWATARRDRLRFRIEDALRALKHRVEAIVAHRAPGAT